MEPYILQPDQEHALERFLVDEEQGVDEATACGHDDPLTESMARALVAMGFLATRVGEPGYELTEKGRTAARDVVRRHRLTEVLLDSVLKIDRKRAFDIGCQMEHEMQPEMVEAFCTLLGHPTVCPHGRPIPPGPCCEAHRTTVEQQVVPLTDLAPGERGRIIFIQPRSHGRLHRLSSLGVTPGVIVTVHQRQPALCFRYEGTEIAVERDVARDIHVSRVPTTV